MEFHRPKGLFAGFHAVSPDSAVPELAHLGEQWASVDFAIPEHTHPVWEFYLQIGGESQWDGDGKTHMLRPGGFFASAPGVTHQMRDRPRARHHFLFAAIDVDAICRRHHELHGYWRGHRIVFEPHGETLQASFRQLIREVSASLPHRTLGIRAALDSLVIEATRLLGNEQKVQSWMASHPAVVRVKEMLDHHPGEHWKLGELARLAGISPSRLSECFARELGVSPHQYLLRRRIESAKEALKQSDVSVTDLALELGFSSSQHFASTFKRMAGVSARAFRAR